MHELILVVDDNKSGLELTRSILLGAGYLVMTALDAEDALDLLSSAGRLPDLIILDMNLPKMPGLEFARKIREVGCDIPMIAFTAYSTREWNFPQAAYEAGCNGFVEKTDDVDILPRVVGQFFRRQASEK